jgi:hypothetical protein
MRVPENENAIAATIVTDATMVRASFDLWKCFMKVSPNMKYALQTQQKSLEKGRHQSRKSS